MVPRFSSEYLSTNDEFEKVTEIVVRGVVSKEYEAVIEEIDAKIKIFCGLSEGGKTSAQKHLSYNADLRIESREIQPFAWFEDKLTKLQNLFTLLIGIPTNPKFVRVCSESANEIDTALGGDVQVFYIIHNPQLIEQIRDHDMLTIFPWLEKHFSSYLNQWFAKSDHLKPIYALFFATLVDASIYLEQKFLSRIQALESFHRRIYGNDAEYISALEYEDILRSLESALPNDISADFKKKLINSFRYGNQFSLRKRLQQLTNACWDGCFENFIPKKSDFIQVATDTRNYLTHLDDNSKGKVAEGIELYLLNERLKFLLFIVFLNELGVSKEDAYTFLKPYKSISRFTPRFFW